MPDLNFSLNNSWTWVLEGLYTTYTVEQGLETNMSILTLHKICRTFFGFKSLETKKYIGRKKVL